MKNLLQLTTLIVLLSIIPFESFSQGQYSYSASYEKESFFSMQVGSGITYGGKFGLMATFKANEWLGIFGAVGHYSGVPLGFGFYDYYSKRAQRVTYDVLDFTKNTLTGFGYTLGAKFCFNDFYMGLQYFSAGEFNDIEKQIKMPISGINWTMFGGNHSIRCSRFFFDWALNLGMTINSDSEGEIGGVMLGLSLGLGYEF